MCTNGNRLLRIVCGVAVESGEDTTGNPVRESDEDAMLVRLCKPAL
jgi:hypothetical protein